MVTVTDEQFDEYVVQAIDSIPSEYANQIDNVGVVVSDDTDNPRLLGLYEGVPLTKRWRYGGVPPDKITIYKDAICRMCRTEDQVREQVRRTVIHEFGHYFGIGDDRLRELGW